MEPGINIHKLSNGMTLVVETVGDVSSASFVVLVPAGASRDPQGRTGASSVLSEWVFRGAGNRDNKTLNSDIDSLGLQRNSSVSALYTSLSGSLVADNLLEALKIYAEVVRRPRLEDKQFELCRVLALQTLESLEDDPRQKISQLVREHFLPYPYGRSSAGKTDELKVLNHNELKIYWSESYIPDSSILAVAGKVDFSEVVKNVEKCFQDWQGDKLGALPVDPCRPEQYHQPNEGSQVHIGLMYPSVNATDPDYYKAMAAVEILSGGMGSRLFTEVREKRGLCYAVGARHEVIGPYGAVRCYLGSTPEQSQEALDVMVGEIRKLSDGITEEELERAKTGLRASLIMQGESTSARAMACAGDYYYLGRVRTLKEIETAIRELSVNDVLEHVKRYKPENFSLATIGPKELTLRY